MLRVAVVGSREYPDIELVREHVQAFAPDVVVVSGGARGVDSIAVAEARKRGLAAEVFPADWLRYGKSAGPRRNKQMIDTVTHVVAFWDGQSRGTKHAIEYARSQGKSVEVVMVEPGAAGGNDNE